MTSSSTDVAVIGDGFSAVATTINLIERLPPETSVSLIGPSGGESGGAAYATDDPDHLLNVPAGRMSLFPDRADDFARWLGRAAPGFGPDDYAPRRLYRAYIRDRLREVAVRSDNTAAFRAVPARADAIEPDGAGYRVRLSSGASVSTRALVLCLGNTAAPFPIPADRIDHSVRDRIVGSAWLPWMDGLDADARIVLIGTGLTMVDQVVSLTRRGHRGPVHAISRRGLLPRPHLVPRGHPVDMSSAVRCRGLSSLAAEVISSARATPDWRTVIDGLRPLTHDIWAGLSDSDRRRFLRHLLPWWTVHRHRMAPVAAATIDAAIDGRRLTVRAGRPTRITAAADGAAIVHVKTRDGSAVPIPADVVVNCTGTERCPDAVSSPVLSSLFEGGLAVADPLGLGITVDERSAVVAACGRADPALRAVGPLTAGRFWEITAVPDIRVQAAAVADEIARGFP